jgi:hypothetical protein
MVAADRSDVDVQPYGSMLNALLVAQSNAMSPFPCGWTLLSAESWSLADTIFMSSHVIA